MEFYVLIIIFVLIIITYRLIRASNSDLEKKSYLYSKKQAIMTKTEVNFYLKLQNIIGEKYIVIPQAHISMFLDHKIPGQSWKGAFSRINGKSVDFLICEKEELKPIFAIELDDYSHGREDRVIRDEFVNSIFRESNMILVRFRQGEWDDEQAIYSKIKSVAMQTNPSEPHE